jgi:hypothetical protein
MAEKKTTTKKTPTKKASKQAKPKAVDMVSPVTPADETGLELTEKMRMQAVADDNFGVAEIETENLSLNNPSFDQGPKGDEELLDLNEPMIDFQEDKNIEPKQSVVEEEVCDKENHDDHEQDACMQEQNQELETPEPLFKEDKAMVNDITNILNGIDGVNASKLGKYAEEELAEKEEKAAPVAGKNTTNTEEKNYYSEQFSRNWGGVMYDY